MAAGPGHPRPPKKDLPDHVAEQKVFLDTELRPRLDRTVAGKGHVLFVDAARFVYGTSLSGLRSIPRVFVRAAGAEWPALPPDAPVQGRSRLAA